MLTLKEKKKKINQSFHVGLAIIVTLLVCKVVWSVYENSVVTENKPDVTVHEINMSPENFFQIHKEIMPKSESQIFKYYSEGINKKWTTEYKYVYVILYETPIQTESAEKFSRNAYLDSHPGDAVDTKLIFSNQPADPKFFNIQEAATRK